MSSARLISNPASSAEANLVVHAGQIFTAADDGLQHPWCGRVWMSPPHARPLILHFACKLVAHVRLGHITGAVVLVNNATDTVWFRTLADAATAFCFPKGRIKFWTPGRGTATPLQGQVFLYFGPARDAFLREFSPFGFVRVPARGDGDA